MNFKDVFPGIKPKGCSTHGWMVHSRIEWVGQIIGEEDNYYCVHTKHGAPHFYTYRDYTSQQRKEKSMSKKGDVESIPLDDENTIKYLLGEGEDLDPSKFPAFKIDRDDPSYKKKARLLGRLIPVLPEKHRTGYIEVPPNCKSDDQITLEIFLSPEACKLYDKLVKDYELEGDQKKAA
jgi:hypothetical protein